MTSLPIAAIPALARYDEACRAVAEASTVDDVREITGHAEAVRAYAKQAKNRQLEIDAAEIRIRAERRLGELMAAQAETVGMATGGQPHQRASTGLKNNPVAAPTLAEAGIDKNLAHRARTLASVPPEKFEALLSGKRERADRRVVLDADFQAEAAAAARDLEIERDERIALAGADALAAENASLRREVEILRQRVAALVEEIATLKYRVKLWKERAETGWTPTPVKGGQNDA